MRLFNVLPALLAVAYAACGPAAAATSVAPPPAVTRPQWISKPSGEDVDRFYPSAAASMGASGRAVIVCKIDTNGFVGDCVVTSETPPGLGFGEAAVKLSTLFRMAPQTVDGSPVGGIQVHIPIRFEPPRISTSEAIQGMTKDGRLAAFRDGFPTEWTQLVSLLDAEIKGGADGPAIQKALGAFLRQSIESHAEDKARAPAAVIRTAIAAQIEVLQALEKQSPADCARFAINNAVPPDVPTDGPIGQALVRVGVANVKLMAAGAWSPVDYGDLTEADEAALAQAFEKRGGDPAQRALLVRRSVANLSFEQICHTAESSYQAALDVPDAILGRFWKSIQPGVNGPWAIPKPAAALHDGA